MELARKILMKIEEKSNPDEVLYPEDAIEGYSNEQITYHFKLLTEADLIDAVDASSADGMYWMAKNLTWAGHEFLDAVRNETVWNKTKEIVKDKGGSIPFEILKGLSLQVAKSFFGI